SLIGVAYLYMAVVWQQRLLKGAIAACGLYLIAMNFFPASLPLDIIGIVCILTPMIIARTSKESKT
ncbi:MAG TPA: hypothetical protein VK907_04325, partial [Phnomibacter sp.]|nr:hypothetical protein [Phnomibacter sp.]